MPRAMATATLSAKARALRWLAQREHSRAELERKLARHVADTPESSAATQITRALDELAASGLLDDARVAESVLAAAGRRQGSLRLRQTLQAKGLAPELVATTLARSRSTELDRAREVWQRRFGTPPADAADRARQMRFLAGRGFDTDTIRRVVRGGGDDTD